MKWVAAQEMGGTGQQENLCQPFKSGSYPLRLITFLGDAPQAGLYSLYIKCCFVRLFVAALF